jgi:hypothetical protein
LALEENIMSIKLKHLALIGSLTLAAMAVVQHPVTATDAAPSSASSAAAAPRLWVTPLTLDFGPVGVGMPSVTQVVTITNLGSATLTNFAGGGVYAPFQASQDCAAGVLPGDSCNYYFKFNPTSTGTFSATSNSSTNAGPFSVALRGTGVGAGLHVNPLALDFGYVLSGSTSNTQIATIRNTGPTTLTSFGGGGVYAPFHATQDCGGGVPPGGSCKYFFTFQPTQTGTFSTTSNSGTNAGPFTIALEGHGRSPLLTGGQRVTPLSIDFGPVGVGFRSGPQVVTITNQSSFTIVNFAGGGVGAPFQAQQNCAGGVPVGGNCQFFYYFQPTAVGTFSETSYVSDSLGSVTIHLRGTGVGAGLHVTPLSLDFGPVTLFTLSPLQTVTIRNTGATTLTNFAGGGVLPPFSAMQNCASGVPPGGSCQYFFRFSPTSLGRYTTASSSGTNAGQFSIQLYGGETMRVFLPTIMRQ